MIGDERHNAFVAGYELGLALRCDMDTAAAEHEARHALVRPIVDAMVADLNRRGPGDFAQLEERRRQHQLEALQRNQAAARPWPPEDPRPSARVLSGWPDLPKRVNA